MTATIVDVVVKVLPQELAQSLSAEGLTRVDAVSFAIIAERDRHAALTRERHFAIAGHRMVTE